LFKTSITVNSIELIFSHLAISSRSFWCRCGSGLDCSMVLTKMLRSMSLSCNPLPCGQLIKAALYHHGPIFAADNGNTHWRYWPAMHRKLCPVLMQSASSRNNRLFPVFGGATTRPLVSRSMNPGTIQFPPFSRCPRNSRGGPAMCAQPTHFR